LEKLNFGNPSGKAKVLGSLLGIGGAMLLTLYKGVEINIWSTHVDLLQYGQHRRTHVTSPQEESGDRVLGCLLSVGSGTCYALWLIVQAKMTERYPCYYSSTALMSIMASIQTTVFAIYTERDWNQWKLGWDIRLLSVVYAGTVVSGLMVTLIAWCVHLRGPVFVSVFNPLMLVLVAIAGSLVLNEKLHLGSLLGAVLIVLGLYLVLWGKGKEMKKKSQLAPSQNFGDQLESIGIAIVAPSENNNKVCAKNNISNNGNITIVAANDLSNANSIFEKEHHEDNNSCRIERQ
ncbi:Plant-drug/metabolite exporter, partial [Trema orientale]